MAAITSLVARLPRGLVPLPARPAGSHKGTFGHVLLIGGSRGMSGAIALAGMAALRSGAGLVTLAVPDRCADIIAGFHPCYMCRPLQSDAQGRFAAGAEPELRELISSATSVGIGPGMGRSAAVRQLVTTLYRDVERPMVIDADGLNVLAERSRPFHGAAGPRVITPHPGEFARLIGQRDLSRPEQIEQANELASQSGVVCVLKGHQTFVSDGTQRFINPTGNPGMATGGTGDVLTGVVTTLLGQGLSAWHAACLAVFVHGLAGDLAAEHIGQIGLTARDVIEWLPAAFRQLSALSSEQS
jgi:NAD(P)H-hydrate epimerase